MLRASAVVLILLLFICSAVSATADTNYSPTDRALEIIGSGSQPLTDSEKQQLYDLGFNDEEIESLISLATLSTDINDTNPYVIALIIALLGAVAVTVVMLTVRKHKKANPSS